MRATRVFVTGGTGFVGAHTVVELVRAGYEVCLLVRAADRIPPALAPLGIGEVDHVVGDLTDPASVERGMRGCDAVLHAAAVYSLDVREAKRMRRVNVEGTETVLGTAARMKLDPVVYVSSVLTLRPGEGDSIDEQSPVREPHGAYFRSKADAEAIARRYQDEGAPIAISYPGSVNGPDDPHFGESARLVASIVKRLLPVVPGGGLSLVDVRDVAAAHAAMLEPGRGPRRYLLSGTNVPLSSIVDLLEEVTARRIPHVVVPAWTLRPVVTAASLLQRVLPFRLPLSPEGFDAVAWDVHGDDARAGAELGFSSRDPRESLADEVAWLYRVGRLSARQAGRLAAESG